MPEEEVAVPARIDRDVRSPDELLAFAVAGSVARVVEERLEPEVVVRQARVGVERPGQGQVATGQRGARKHGVVLEVVRTGIPVARVVRGRRRIRTELDAQEAVAVDAVAEDVVPCRRPGDEDPEADVVGDHVAVARIHAADRVVRQAADLDTMTLSERSGAVGTHTDLVSLDHVCRSRGCEEDTIAGVARDDVPAHGGPRGTEDLDPATVASVPTKFP